ncbi:MAG: S8 family serine peptidase [Melioribacteraceae bacterium]|nr:S8 family serine peptidase [Melioribacteraceae bacterium]
MKFLSLTLFLFFISTIVFSQNKYFVYFNDKGIESQTLNKSSRIYEEAEKLLSKESIERRKQVMGNDYITFEDIPVNEKYIGALEAAGIKVVHQLKWFNAVSCYLSELQLNDLKKLSFIKRIEPVRAFTKRVIPKEPSYKEPQLNKSNYSFDYGNSFTQNLLLEIPAVHDLGFYGQNAIVGIINSGFRRDHPSLESRIVIAEKDFINNDDTTSNQDNDLFNQDSVGTTIFSVIGGFAPGYLIGPAFGSRFLLAKTDKFLNGINIEEDNQIAALQWMEEMGVDITLSSVFDPRQLSYTFQNMNGKTSRIAQAVNLAYLRGVSTFTAAGDGGANYWGTGIGGIQTPADAASIISVGAVNENKLSTVFSSRGPTSDGRIKPEIVAQGTEILHGIAGSTYNTNVSFGGGEGTGTEFSAALAAGSAALLKSVYPHLTNKQIRQIMLESGDNTAAPNNVRGYGLISAKKAITFPNFEFVNDQPVINKIFLSSGQVNESTIKIFIREENQPFQEGRMTKKGSIKFAYELLPNFAGKNFEFFFTFQNNAGINYREPVPTLPNYRFKYGSWAIDNILTGFKQNDNIPVNFSLQQNYPNPFNPVTNISYSLPVASFVTLKVFDLLGREVGTLINEFKLPGNYNSQFSILNLPAGRQGSKLSSGVYIYQLKAGDFIQSKKMMVLK